MVRTCSRATSRCTCRVAYGCDVFLESLSFVFLSHNKFEQLVAQTESVPHGTYKDMIFTREVCGTCCVTCGCDVLGTSSFQLVT